ncbi:MAG TPA: ABC transporter ATP-binding protein [Quisquiliibacterium sp.]|nr:ABC transporter ATP-binding protein [Quisquiliibacterium sp.]
MTASLRIEALAYAWPGAQAPCLRIDALEIARGERVFLHGPSGSGKSTLLGLIGLVLRPGAGTITLAGQDTGRLSGTARDRMRADHIGVIFQQFNLIPYLSVLDNVLLACRFSARRRAQLQDAGSTPTGEAARLLRQLDLATDHWTRPAARLSVGQQQRVAMARALIGGPELILADEPTSALDAPRQQAFLELLLGECTARGTTLVFASHDRSLARLLDRELDLAALNRAADPDGSA